MEKKAAMQAMKNADKDHAMDEKKEKEIAKAVSKDIALDQMTIKFWSTVYFFHLNYI